MSIFDSFRKSGITQQTPKSLLLNAAVLYKSLKYDSETKKWSGTLLGATSGGTKVNISSDYQEIEIDGAIVKVKGLTQKQGESGSIEANLVEVTADNLKMAIVGEEASSNVEGYSLIRTKALLEDEDYIENIGAVGFLASGKPVIVIMDNMLCTSGLEMETKNKDNVVMKVKFECHAGFDDAHDTLPIKIYYPKGDTPSTAEVVIYTKADLEGLTVSQIEALASERGYTLEGTNKEEKINSFLEHQGGNK